MKTRIVCAITGALAVTAILAAAATAASRIAIYTDNQSYRAGDTIEVSLAGDNLGEGLSVDVYVGLLTPDGALWTVGAIVWWSEAINPWIESIYVPAGFTMNQKRFFSFDLPSGIPPIQVPGEYSFAAVLTEPGTFNWVCDASFAPFAVFSVGGVDYYVDGARGEDYEWYDGSEDLPWKTITHALNSVVASPATPATIHVAGGVYSASTNGETFPLNMKSWVSLVGDGADVTVLDAIGASTSVICCLNCDDCVIEGFTITGGDADRGGGIYCEGGSPVIKRNAITGNSASSGGGIYSDGGRTIILNNIISDNSGYIHGGGGIYCGKGYPTIQKNTIERNWADCEGGGIACYHTSWAIIYGNTIESNTASTGGGIGSYLAGLSISCNSITDNSAQSGGGIGCQFGQGWILDNTVSGNWAENFGGGISWLGAWESILPRVAADFYQAIENNQIVRNSSGYEGGGICCEGVHWISNNTIAENTAEANGGGICCGWATMFNNTVSGNVAGGLGGGIYCQRYTGTAEITDSIVWNNGDDLAGCTASYSDIEDGDAGTGNISADPRFVDAAGYDFHLRADSPCVDAGAGPSVFPYVPDTDWDGDVRPMGSGYDIGGDEVYVLVYLPLVLRDS